MTTITLDIPSHLLKRLHAEAKASGKTVEERARQALTSGYGVPAAEVVAALFEDARDTMASRAN